MSPVLLLNNAGVIVVLVAVLCCSSLLADLVAAAIKQLVTLQFLNLQDFIEVDLQLANVATDSHEKQAIHVPSSELPLEPIVKEDHLHRAAAEQWRFEDGQEQIIQPLQALVDG